jgi:hypothetical protein
MLLFLLLAGCDDLVRPKGCTLMGVRQGVAVHIDRTGWPDGEQELLVALDDIELACVNGPHPQATSPDDEDQWWTCDDGLTWTWATVDQQVLDLLFENSFPDEVTVTVVIDDVAYRTLGGTPSYRTSEPNGEGCGEATIGHLDL